MAYISHRRIIDICPGFALATLLAVCAEYIAHISVFPAMLFALILGLVFSPVKKYQTLIPGINWTGKYVLQLGVVLLGLRIDFDDIISLGFETLALIVVALITTIIFGVFIAKAFKMNHKFGLLSGGATAICGVSAAMALASVMPETKQKDRDLVLVILGITTLSSIAMVLYPIISHFLNLSGHDAGVLFGATIHNIPQVVGAGYMVSEQTAEVATITKLVRISFLLPVVLCFAFLFNKENRHYKNSYILPKFLILFLAVVVLNQTFNIPANISNFANSFAKACFVISITAIGVKSSIRAMLGCSIKPIAIMVLQSLWLLTFVLLFL